MRNRFDAQLDLLNREMIEMGSMCEELISMVSRAMAEGNLELARQVKLEGTNIDQMEREIESLCMKLLLQQQPVARDLRQISAALKMITDMERIGDQAEDIAEIVTELKSHPIGGLDYISQMANATTGMVTASVDAYVKKDIALAESVLKNDDIVDNYFSQMKQAIIDYITNNPKDGEFALDLLMIAKYFERIGDHATNIAEWVIYSVTGRHEEA